jgi:hypothetical protein
MNKPKDPQNFSRHSRKQLSVLRRALKELGWADAPLFDEVTGGLIDGHLRKKISYYKGRPSARFIRFVGREHRAEDFEFRSSEKTKGGIR